MSERVKRNESSGDRNREVRGHKRKLWFLLVLFSCSSFCCCWCFSWCHSPLAPVTANQRSCVVKTSAKSKVQLRLKRRFLSLFFLIFLNLLPVSHFSFPPPCFSLSYLCSNPPPLLVYLLCAFFIAIQAVILEGLLFFCEPLRSPFFFFSIASG